MGRKTLVVSAEEMELYSGCKTCNIVFSKFNSRVLVDGKPEPYSIAKLKSQYEQHIASKGHQALVKKMEEVASNPTGEAALHTSSLELQVKQLQQDVDNLKNMYITISQVNNQYSNEVNALRAINDALLTAYRQFNKELFGNMNQSQLAKDNLYAYKGFNARLSELEARFTNPIPNGEKAIPTPVNINKHTVLELRDENYKLEKITPKTMILTEQETPKPVPMIPASLTLDALKGIKKIEVKEEYNDIRHFIAAPIQQEACESEDEDSASYESSEYQDSDDELDHDPIIKNTEVENLMDHQNPYKFEIYGETYQQIQGFKDIITDKDEDNHDRLENIYYQIGKIQEWIRDYPLGQFKNGTNRDEAKRIYDFLELVYKRVEHYYDNYDTIEWDKNVANVGNILFEIANTVFTKQGINSGELLPGRGKK